MTRLTHCHRPRSRLRGRQTHALLPSSTAPMDLNRSSTTHSMHRRTLKSSVVTPSTELAPAKTLLASLAMCPYLHRGVPPGSSLYIPWQNEKGLTSSGFMKLTWSSKRRRRGPWRDLLGCLIGQRKTGGEAFFATQWRENEVYFRLKSGASGDKALGKRAFVGSRVALVGAMRGFWLGDDGMKFGPYPTS